MNNITVPLSVKVHDTIWKQLMFLPFFIKGFEECKRQKETMVCPLCRACWKTSPDDER